MIEEAKVLVRDGIWQVPPEERPRDWESLGIREPDEGRMLAVSDAPVTAVGTANSQAIIKAPLGNLSPQSRMLQHVNERLERAILHLAEMEAAYENAKRKKWQTSALKRAANVARKEVVYLNKVSIAIGAGFMIMPPIDGEAFAVRISPDKHLPYSWENRNEYSYPSYPEPPSIDTDALPASIGVYVGAEPRVSHRKTERKSWSGDDGGKVMKFSITRPTSFIEEIPFPAVMAKPAIMDRTEEAMALRVFDQMTIYPGQKTKRDPIIIGRIFQGHHSNATKTWRGDYLHFVIAWLVREEDI